MCILSVWCSGREMINVAVVVVLFGINVKRGTHALIK
jgi:hypothetical protein